MGGSRGRGARGGRGRQEMGGRGAAVEVHEGRRNLGNMGSRENILVSWSLDGI